MKFVEYLSAKKIAPVAFRNEEPEMYQQWEQLFVAVHPESFTQQKLYLINGIRRRFPLSAEVENKKKAAAAATSKAVVMPKRKND